MRMSFKVRIALTPGTQDRAKENNKGACEVAMRSPQMSLMLENPFSGVTIFAPILNDQSFY
jgi:hypothetical protein